VGEVLLSLAMRGQVEKRSKLTRLCLLWLKARYSTFEEGNIQFYFYFIL